jgi:putative hydrolase of the HAD superfamily
MRAGKPPNLTVSAVFIDALGTLVELEPPWVHLADQLGVPSDDRMIRAVRSEMAYYRENSHLGADATSLRALRERCAELLSAELGQPVDVETMMAAIRFRPYADALPALAGLRRRGLRLVCVSNWDCSLPQVLERCGLAGELDGVVTSAGAGARKPDGRIFTPALELAGCEPGQALHVGDSPEDVAAATAAGIAVLLLDREGGGDIASLSELVARIDTMRG